LIGGEQQEGAREGPGGRTLGQARGTSAHANNAEYARRERESASRRSAQDTLRIRRTRALEARRGDEAHGARDGARDAEFGLARTLQEADVWRSVRGDAKMDAEAVVVEELKSGRNSDKLANALSLLTAL
jgi:hypothetical protein